MASSWAAAYLPVTQWKSCLSISRRRPEAPILNILLFSQPSPSSSLIIISQVVASFAVLNINYITTFILTIIQGRVHFIRLGRLARIDFWTPPLDSSEFLKRCHIVKKSPKKSPSRVTFQGSYFFCRGELNEPFYKRVEKKWIFLLWRPFLTKK